MICALDLDNRETWTDTSLVSFLKIYHADWCLTSLLLPRSSFCFSILERPSFLPCFFQINHMTAHMIPVRAPERNVTSSTRLGVCLTPVWGNIDGLSLAVWVWFAIGYSIATQQAIFYLLSGAFKFMCLEFRGRIGGRYGFACVS